MFSSLTGRACGLGTFSQFKSCAHFPQFERRRRQVGADVLPRTRLVASKFCAALLIGRSHQRTSTAEAIRTLVEWGIESAKQAA